MSDNFYKGFNFIEVITRENLQNLANDLIDRLNMEGGDFEKAQAMGIDLFITEILDKSQPEW